MEIREKKLLLFLLLFFILASCVGNSGNKSRQPLTVAQVKMQPQIYKGRSVRWGGRILSVKNNRQNTEIEVQSYGLSINGKPRLSGSTHEARFIAVFPGFKDPAHFEKGKRIRVDGIVTGSSARNLDSYRYVYPRVSVGSHRLWDKPSEYGRYNSSVYWGLGWGLGRYGGHRHHGRHGHRVGVGWGW